MFMPVQMPILLGDLYCICVGVLPTVGGMDARLATTAAASNPPQLAPLASPLARGYALGLLGVVLFALTIPMTRLAGGSALFCISLNRCTSSGIFADCSIDRSARANSVSVWRWAHKPETS